MAGCKVGDICVILPDPTDNDHRDTGRLVRVVAPGADYSDWPWCDSRLHWRIVPVDGGLLSYYTDPALPVDFDDDCDCPDQCLQPIRGQRRDESESTDQPIAEVA